MVALNFVKPAIGIFLLPLYLNVLSDTEYGLYTLMVAVSGIVNIVGTFRINAAMTTFYWDYNHDAGLTKKYLQQIFSFSFLLSVICMVFFLIFGPIIFKGIFKDETITFFPYGIIVIATGVLNATNSVYYIYLKNRKEFNKLSLILFVQIMLAVLIQVVLILGFEKGVYGLLLGVMIPYLLTLLYILIIEPKILRFKFDKKILIPSLKYSIALIPFLLIYWLSSTGDRIILEKYLDLGVIGQYALLMTIARVLFLVADSVMNAIRPFIYESFQDKESDQSKWTAKERNAYQAKLIKFYMSLNIITAGGILLIGHNLSFITDKPAFLNAIPYFTLATTIIFLRSYLLIFNMQLNYAKSSKLISSISIVSLVILLSLYHFLSKQYGLEGVLYAGLIAGVFTSLVFFAVAQMKKRIAYNMFDLWIIPILCFMLFFMVNHFLTIDVRIKGLIQFIISILAFFIILRGNIKEVIALVNSKQSIVAEK